MTDVAPETGKIEYFAPVTLMSTGVELVPLSKKHTMGLATIAGDPVIWQWMPTAHHEVGTMADFVDGALALRDQHRAIPFATVDRLSGRIAGSTRFHFIEPEQRRLEIGVTWIGRDFQRSHINTEAKLLQMWYAFEVLGCRRVEWKADAENARSRAAILRLGAKEEGIFRKHMIYSDGRNRDSVYFAIVDDDWLDVKRRLEQKLKHSFTPAYSMEKDDRP